MKKTSTLLLALGLFSTTAATAQSTLNNGLMAYYPFNGTPQDVSGNNRHLTNMGATATADANGNSNAAYYFNGITSYMQLSANAGIDFIGDFTICMKIKPMGFCTKPCHGNMLFNKTYSFNDPYGVFIQFDDAYYTNYNNCNIPAPDTLHQSLYVVKSHMGTITSAGYTPTAPYVASNTWYDLVVTSKGDSLSEYINGVLIHRTYSGFFGGSNNYDIFVGKTNNITSTYHYKGAMDELRIYNRALTDTEVVQYTNYDPLAVKEVNAAMAISVSPNPATDVLRLTNPSNQEASFRVLDLQGREMISGVAPSGETVLPVSHLSSGMYLLQVQEGKAAVQTLRFVKQ